MLPDAIRSLLGRAPAPSRDTESAGAPDPLHVAACALLLEVAHADGEFSAAERAHLELVLARHFGLAPDDGRALIALAEEERRSSIDHFGFTVTLRRDYDLQQKMVLAEVMWGLVLADGRISEHEHYLTRKIANLLELAPGSLSEAKARARAAADDAGRT